MYIETFVNSFGNEFINNVPTCGIVGIKFDTDHWKSIKRGKTFIVDFPKDH